MALQQYVFPFLVAPIYLSANVRAKVAAGENAKAQLKVALQACYDAAEVYFDTAVKYVALYTYPEALKQLSSNELRYETDAGYVV